MESMKHAEAFENVKRKPFSRKCTNSFYSQLFLCYRKYKDRHNI